ncbi:ECF transporter S component [Corynebacterium sp. TAE3-ERU12]|nr:ECF transporter S component [Corynebacterium sp. TAE3-ERU12]
MEPAHRNLSWRLVDIVVAAVLGVATGLIFLVWNYIGGRGYEFLDGFTPGLSGLAGGGWLIGGVLGGLIIRKPGAALFVEMVGASVSAAVGNEWGYTVLWSGLAQGAAAELAFLILAYKFFGLKASMFAGAMAGFGMWAHELFLWGNIEKSLEFNMIYLVAAMISGAVIAGVGGWLLTRALAATGALDRFAAGREARDLV